MYHISVIIKNNSALGSIDDKSKDIQSALGTHGKVPIRDVRKKEESHNLYEALILNFEDK